jgi:hypothetical protein
MSTQRRENRWQRTSCTHGAGVSRVPGDRSSSWGWRVPGHANPAPTAQHGRAQAKVGTAPPAAAAWLATNSLQSDYRTMQLIQLVRLVRIVQFVPFFLLVEFFSRLAYPSAGREKQNRRHTSRSAPPSGAALGAASGTLAALRSSLSFIPSPSGLDRLHPTLPQFPAGERRWTERYDGKGNLHLLHAA